MGAAWEGVAIDEVAAHQPGELAGDGEPETDRRRLQRRSVGTLVRLEDRLLASDRYAGTVVRDNDGRGGAAALDRDGDLVASVSLRVLNSWPLDVKSERNSA